MKYELSVITVCLNDYSNLAKTLESIKKQKFKMEYIIVDGNSNDGSKQLLENEISWIDHLIIEKDKGLYDAMNKGVLKSSGEWIMFLNAGDVFDNNQVLQKIFNSRNLIKNNDIVFGDTKVMHENGEENYIEAGSLKNIDYGMQFSHQSMLVRKNLQNKYLYNLNFKYAADYDFILNSFYNKKNFGRFRGPIAKMSTNGVSDINRIPVLKEWLHISKKKSFKGVLIMLIKLLFQYFKKLLKI